MNWTRFLLAVVVSGLAASVTDWLFMACCSTTNISRRRRPGALNRDNLK
jgi:hypothetical protein